MPKTEYKTTKSWNPFVGCGFDCTYCKPSFKDLIAWFGRMRHCESCQQYEPHEHPERLTRIPSDKTIFVCEDGDISFALPAFMKRVFEAMRGDKKIGRVWFLQSKSPSCFEKYLHFLPKNTYLVTTLETNRDEGYELVSKAPKPSVRYKEFLALSWDKKVVTVEPLMDFDLDVLSEWIISIKPKAVFVGFNSNPDAVKLSEPSVEKALNLISYLREKGLQVLEKDMRDPMKKKNAYRDFVPWESSSMLESTSD